MKRYLPHLPAFAGAIALLFSSCEKAPTLTLTGPATVSLSAEGGSETFTFTSNRDWTVSTPDSWLTVLPTSGTASGNPVTVTVGCDANTAFEDRQGTITIMTADMLKTLPVTAFQPMLPVIPQKAVIFGNSIVAGFPYEGGMPFGACASEPSKDFCSRLFSLIRSKNKDFTGSKVGTSAFEILTNTDDIDDYIQTYFAPYLAGDESLVVVELGDNVRPANIPVFRESSVALLEFLHRKCPSARIAWAGVWYSYTEILETVMNACEKTQTLFIPISDLATNENRGAIGGTVLQGSSVRTISNVLNVTEDTPGTISVTFVAENNVYSATMPVASYSLADKTLTYVGQYSVVTSEGVASHPGDAGMLAIANRLAYSLKITPDESTID